MSTRTHPAAAPAPTSAPHPTIAHAAAARPALSPVTALFTAAVFTSAFLLFLVQPMFSRMVLPLLGGTPAVWNTCMLFFQAALLAGYGYAHLGARRLGVRAQAGVHLALLAAAALVLPVALRGAAPRGGDAPIPWLLGTMTLTVGLPFFALSGTGPILQRWFAHSGRRGAGDPYWLYAASNLGSMLALLGYPVLMEPRLRLAEQSATWTAGYALLWLLAAACAVAIWRSRASADDADAAPSSVTNAPMAGRERLVWVGLAFIPSSMLLSVTTFITTDLAPVPLLWVLPLALYLLTFTIAFSPRPLLRHPWMVAVQPFLLAVVALLLMCGFLRAPEQVIPLHLLALFATGMVCHGELSRRRPAAGHLTEFYLWISVGGVLGGIFNVLVAPLVFSRTWEYPIIVAAACLARPWGGAGQAHAHARRRWETPVRAVAITFALLLVAGSGMESMGPALKVVVPLALAAMVALMLRRSPAWLAACLATALAVRSYIGVHDEAALLTARSFYGRYTVLHEKHAGGFHVLYHGSTLHGAQSLWPGRRREPLTYYLLTGPFGQLMKALPRPAGTRRVAIVGLGTGTTAAYGARGDAWTFYEIDPGIERIARDARYFTYLADSPARTRVVLGDARLSLARAPGAAYDLIVLDAFSSDAIPMHLLTRQALEMYLQKLAPGGVIAFHLSNRYLRLEPVVAALANERGLASRVGENTEKAGRFHSSSTWMVVARSPADLGSLAADSRWRAARPSPRVHAWTDDYYSLLSVLGR